MYMIAFRDEEMREEICFKFTDSLYSGMWRSKFYADTVKEEFGLKIHYIL